MLLSGWICHITPHHTTSFNKSLSFLQVLQDQEGLAVQKSEGRVGPHPPNTWALYFRYTFRMSQACRVELELQLAGEALLKAASLVLVDNDTSQVLPFI